MVVPGHGVASGRGGDARFPAGTIRLQLPALRAGVPGLEDWLRGPVWPGTLNLALPTAWRLGAPAHRLEAVRWSAAMPPETFFLARAEIVAACAAHPAWLYIPDPATKPDHHQPAEVIELLAAFIPGLTYGTEVVLRYDAGAITLA